MGAPERPAPLGECPNCLSELETVAGGLRVCPVCRFSLRPCPGCGGEMALQVEVPDGVGIEEAGLPLDLCEQTWVCRDPACGRRMGLEE